MLSSSRTEKILFQLLWFILPLAVLMMILLWASSAPFRLLTVLGQAHEFNKTSWVLRNIYEDDVVIEDTRNYEYDFQVPWVQFSADQFEGTDGCNEYWGRVEFSRRGEVRIPAYMITLNGCETIEQVYEDGESVYLSYPIGTDVIYHERFFQIHSYSLDGAELRLYYGDGVNNYLLYERQPFAARD
ncbi:MAG: META domain-containing protein [Anaerolineales bacterium]|nr:META domain-containing protein [Anaerolineales bacterium]